MQLIALGTGKPKALLKLMISPEEGLLSKQKFLPSIAEVGEWLDEHDATKGGPAPDGNGLPYGVPLPAGAKIPVMWVTAKHYYIGRFGSAKAFKKYCSDLHAGFLNEGLSVREQRMTEFHKWM